MQPHFLLALVSLAAVFTYMLLGLNVGRVRMAVKIMAPQMTGDPRLERAIRVHYNTLEWLPTFLVSMWLFGLYWNEQVAAGLGAVWIIGRILYATGYMADPAKRGAGFGIQFLVTLVLLLGGLGRLIWMVATKGAL